MRIHSSLPKLILILIAFGLLIVATDILSRKLFLSGQTETVALLNGEQKTKEREKLLLNFFKHSENTIKAIRESEGFRNFLKAPSSQYEFRQLALTIARSQENIMKIRYIDESGMEVLRIDRQEPGELATAVPSTELQNKSHRYFYTESINKPLEKVWFTDIDLNEDNGKVEIPYKATLRVVMPITHNEDFGGILIINYFMQPLFELFTNTPIYNSILVDSDGNILIHYDPSRNWSQYKNKSGIKPEIPDFDQLVSHETYRTPNLFSRRLDIPSGQKLILILSLDKKSTELQKSISDRSLMYSSGITFVITIIFGFIFAKLLNRFFRDYATRGQYIENLMDLNLRINNLLERNKVYMDMASDGVHILDKKGNVVIFSHSFADMLGYSEEETAKLNVRDWEAILTPEQIKDVMNTFTKQPKRFETKHRRKDGSIIDVEINAKWVTTSEGDFFYASSRDITERIRLEKELHQLATTDALTQLPVRRVFMEQLENELERYLRKQISAVSVIYLDLDHFKNVNDTYGHGVGDKVLINVASILNDEIRKVDSVGRLGGEEFALILTGTTAEMAVHFTNRIRRRIEQSPLVLDHTIIHCTVSMGITTMNAQDSNVDEILDRADKALYKAKELGRNRVEIYKDSV